MSYILKALNQADADRRRGQTPDVLSPVAASARQKSGSNLPTILTVVLALNSAVLAYVYWPQSEEQALPQTGDAVPLPAPVQPAQTQSRRTADSQRKSSTPQPSSNRLLAETRVAPKPQPATVERTAPERGQEMHTDVPIAEPTTGKTPVMEAPPTQLPVAKASGSTPTAGRPAEPSRAAPQPALAGTPATPQGTDTRVVVADTPAVTENGTMSEQKRIPLVHELTHDVQSQLPPLQVNVISYSEVPKRRFAIINMKKYREGDKLADSNVSVYRITRDGAILDYGTGLARLPGGIR